MAGVGAAQRCIAWAGASTTAVACPGAKAGGDASWAGLCGLLQPWKSPNPDTRMQRLRRQQGTSGTQRKTEQTQGKDKAARGASLQA